MKIPVYKFIIRELTEDGLLKVPRSPFTGHAIFWESGGYDTEREAIGAVIENQDETRAMDLVIVRRIVLEKVEKP